MLEWPCRLSISGSIGPQRVSATVGTRNGEKFIILLKNRGWFQWLPSKIRESTNEILQKKSLPGHKF